MQIQTYNDINESHAATGYHGRTDLPGFHIFPMADTYPSTRQVMPPYRFNFYQIVLFEHAPDATLSMNTRVQQRLSGGLFFASPEHVLAWIRGKAQRGYILYFKDVFLPPYLRHVTHEFPFFHITELNSLQLEGENARSLPDHFDRLLRTFNTPHSYRVELLQAYLAALLYDCKRLYDVQEHHLQQRTPQQALTFRFQQLVNQHYITRKMVSDYADMLAVSPDYLGQAVKTVTGKTPLTIISERILLEARTVLAYSDLNISETAAFLGYYEPTHFARFFRRQTGLSPQAWRRNQQHNPEIGHHGSDMG